MNIMEKMIESIKADIEKYETAISEKRKQINDAQEAIRKLDAEAVLFNGALQQCQKMLAEVTGEKVEDVDADTE